MFIFRRTINRIKYAKYVSFNIQYVSDLHVDVNKYIPKINPVAEYLAVCGDIGVPTHPKFYDFFDRYSKHFKKVFFVAGNHDYDCSSYDEKNKDYYKPIISEIINKFPNVYFLDRSCYYLTDNIIIAGTTLWSKPLIIAGTTLWSKPLTTKYEKHINEHEKDVKWINEICELYFDKKIVMLTHHVPTFKLIEKKYKEKGIFTTCWFATELDFMIKKPIVAWTCGHTHSVIETNINGIYCGVNAVGHNSKQIFDKVIQLSE